MAPLIVMVVSWIAARAIGALGVWSALASWSHALRFALAVMFFFTAVSHFHPRTRNNLIQMVPPSMPAPAVLVAVTGVFDASTTVPAAYGLILQLLAMFPANVHAACAGLMVAGRRASPLIWRLPLQMFWMGALWWVSRVTG